MPRVAWWRQAIAAAVLACSIGGAAVGSQSEQPPAPAAVPPAAEPLGDPLGRTTPRGSMNGFLVAAGRGENALAARYLNSRLGPRATESLAHNLFVVLDARMPARLKISDQSDGSRANPLQPDQEVVGTIESGSGALEIVLERVRQRDTPPIWLFSSTTLDRVPALYTEVLESRRQTAILPDSLRNMEFGGLHIVEWLAVAVGLPFIYLLTLFLNRLLTPLAFRAGGRLLRLPGTAVRNVLPVPARLLLVAVLGDWLLAALPLSLRVRQLWTGTAGLLVTISVVWLLMLVNREVEAHLRRGMPRAAVGGGAALLRVMRRAVDLVILFGGFVVMLRQFGIDPTPALAGVGVGGIAVALAAQKTLENVIAGASLIVDQAVRVGDFLKMAEVIGTVEHIGLRSTRIRTLDRTVVSVPNGQIANVTLETLSSRDKFWFHPIVPLRYGTTTEQLHGVVDGIKSLLDRHPLVDRDSVRVRFFRLGAFSMDIDVFAYVNTRDWNDFMAIQEGLLFSVTEIVASSGTAVAIPAQTTYLANAPATLDSRALPLA